MKHGIGQLQGVGALAVLLFTVYLCEVPNQPEGNPELSLSLLALYL